MKKIKLKLSAISVILIFAMIFSSLVSCNAPSESADTTREQTTDQLETREKIYSSATIDDDFDSDMILVWIQPYMYDYEYTVEDFSDIGCVAIDSVKKYPDIKKQKFYLSLDRQSKQNVLDAIKILELRPDILLADICGYDTLTYMGIDDVAALLISHQSNLSPAAIKRIILRNVDSISRLSSYCLTGGRLNANAALRDSAIHGSHTMTLDTSYQDAEEHRYLCYSCGHADYDKHIWTTVQVGSNGAPPPDASVNYIPMYKCTVCNYTTPLPPSGTLTN